MTLTIEDVTIQRRDTRKRKRIVIASAIVVGIVLVTGLLRSLPSTVSQHTLPPAVREVTLPSGTRCAVAEDGFRVTALSCDWSP